MAKKISMASNRNVIKRIINDHHTYVPEKLVIDTLGNLGVSVRDKKK